MSNRKTPSAPIKRKFSLTPSFLDIESIIKTAGESGVRTLEITPEKLKADFSSRSRFFELLEKHKNIAFFIFGIIILACLYVGAYIPKVREVILRKWPFVLEVF